GRIGAGRQRRAGGEQGGRGQAGQTRAERGGGGDDEAVELVERRGAGLDRAGPHGAQHTDRLHDADAGLGGGGGIAGLHRGGGVDRILRVGLAFLPTFG